MALAVAQRSWKPARMVSQTLKKGRSFRPRPKWRVAATQHTSPSLNVHHKRISPATTSICWSCVPVNHMQLSITIFPSPSTRMSAISMFLDVRKSCRIPEPYYRLMDGQGRDAKTVLTLGSHVKTFSAMVHGALVSIVGGFSGFMDWGGMRL